VGLPHSIGPVWFHLDNLVLVAAQAACVALPAAGLPAWLQRFRGGAWALVLPLCIAVVVFGIDLLPESATILSWAALLLIPPGCALALGWAMHGARPALAVLAVPAVVLVWANQDTRAGQIATILLIVGSCVTLGRLLAGAAPLTLLKIGIVAMAVIDCILVFGNQLQAPNATLIAAVPAHGLPQLQSSSFGTAGLGYGDYFAAGVLGGVLAAEGRAQLAAAIGVLAASLAWDQMFFFYDTLPATVPVAFVLVVIELRAVWRGRRTPRTAPGAARLPGSSRDLGEPSAHPPRP
jgi:hypothetical protein